MVTCTGHIGIHEGADGRTDVRTYVRTDVDDVMAIKPNFLTSMGYHPLLFMGNKNDLACSTLPDSRERKTNACE